MLSALKREGDFVSCWALVSDASEEALVCADEPGISQIDVSSSEFEVAAPLQRMMSGKKAFRNVLSRLC